MTCPLLLRHLTRVVGRIHVVNLKRAHTRYLNHGLALRPNEVSHSLGISEYDPTGSSWPVAWSNFSPTPIPSAP